MASSSKGKAKDRSSVDDLTETEFETQGFEARDGDEELLWDVVAILKERGDKYLIKWAGTDDNGKPWPDSWVPRPDVTDDLVQAWRKEHAFKKRERARARAEARERKRRGSNVSRSRTDSKRSTTTLSSATSRRTTRATSGLAAEHEDAARSISLSSTVKNKRKQKFGSEEDDGRTTSEADTPRKKRRLSKKGRDSQSSSPPSKKSDLRLTPTEDSEDPGHKPKSRRQIRREQKEGEEEGYESATAGNAGPNGRGLKVSRHTERRSRKVIRREHEEEEDVEDSNPVATPKSQRTQKLQVEVVMPLSVTKSKPARDTAPNGSPDRLSVHGRKRAHSKSGSERASDDASIAPSSDQAKNRNRKTRKGPPGVRLADVKDPEGDGSAAEQEDDMLSTVETPNSISSGDLLSPRGPEQIATTPPSSLQRGLTARMKGKGGRKILGGESETSVQDTEIPAVAAAHDVFDDPELDPIDDIDVYDFDPLDDAPPISKTDQPTNDHSPATTSFVNDKNAVPDKLDESGLPGEPQSPKAPVVPPTQSQSQSQRESQFGVSDDLHLASILAEHGSASEQADSLRAEILLVPTSSITDPQPSAEPSVKAHKKIPLITPSKFKPYLQQQKPLSALPPPHLALHSEDESDIASQSPLKDFDERVTGRMHNADHAVSLIPVEDAARASVDDIEDEMPHSLELQQRGLELAEMRRRKLREEIQKSTSRISLHELLAKSGESSRSGTLSGGRCEESSASTKHKMINPDVAEEDTLETEIDEARIRQFEEEFLNFDGNAGDDLQASLETAGQEEEEEQRAVTIGDTSEEADAADVESSLQDVAGENDPFLSYGEVTERAMTLTTTSSDQDDTDQPYTPVKRRFKILGSPNKLESPLLRTPSQQLNEAMGLLHAKSGEIEHLKRQLEESVQKRLDQDNVLAEIRAENAVLKKTIENRVTSKELDEELIQQYREKEEGLAKEILALDAEIRLLKMNWHDALKQAEVFRESYERASAFADETKERNAELEERARLAEAQVKSGLNLYRKQYDAKIEKLEMELERQLIEARITKTRDTRTDDEVRRRAALEPELREQIDNLGEEIRDLRIAQVNIVRQRNELLVENQDLKKELEELRSSYDRAAEDLTWSKVQVARLMAREKAFKKVFLTNSASILDSDNDRAEERAFVCKWMSGFDGRTRCNSLFTNVQELKDHLFVDHQL